MACHTYVVVSHKRTVAKSRSGQQPPSDEVTKTGHSNRTTARKQPFGLVFNTPA